MQIRARHWTWAVCAAVFLHAAAAFAILWTPASPGARQIGVGGIDVSLGPAGGAPGAMATSQPLPAEAEQVEPPEAEKRSLPEEAESMPPDAQPVETVKPAEVVPVQMAKAVDPAPVKARPVETPPPPKAKPKPPEPKQVRSPSPPEPKPVAEPAEAKPVDSPPAEQVADLPPSLAGSQGKAGDQAKPLAGSGDMTAGGGRAGAAADYMSVLQAWLEKHKEYPRAARLRRVEGTVLLYFVVGADGEVYVDRIEKTSGHRLLDEEAIAMIQRAKPLPPIPESMKRDRLEVLVPIQFFLR